MLPGAPRFRFEVGRWGGLIFAIAITGHAFYEDFLDKVRDYQRCLAEYVQEQQIAISAHQEANQDATRD